MSKTSYEEPPPPTHFLLMNTQLLYSKDNSSYSHVVLSFSREKSVIAAIYITGMEYKEMVFMTLIQMEVENSKCFVI